VAKAQALMGEVHAGRIEMTRHIIGGSHTYQTALMCCAYLNARYREDSLFRFEHTPTDVYHPYIIYCCVPSRAGIDVTGEAVTICRAFVAGRGEVWT
jgi:hypothetical protein